MFVFRRLKNVNQMCNRTASAKLQFTTSAQPTIQKNGIVKADKRVSFGQPTAETHPHLIGKSELVTGICMAEFQQRRHRLIKAIQKYARESLEHHNQAKNGHLIIIPSATKKFMSEKIPYVFRQNSDFFYLTGCLEQDSVLVLFSRNNDENAKSMLFMRPKDKHAEMWDGARTGVDQAREMFGMDETYRMEQFGLEIARYLCGKKPIVWFDAHRSELKSLNDEINVLNNIPKAALNSPTNFVQGMRLFKSPSEQRLMRRTCQIAAEAINEVMAETQPGESEHYLTALIDFKCRKRNASHLAYPPVVASGNNATTIHYINNTQLTKDGDLVLMDAGCEYAGYSSDITRTWPINGEFSEPQKVLYDVVLQIQKELIQNLMKEGGQSLDELFETMCIRLGKYLQEVGLVPKHISDNFGYAKVGYKFCPHHVSHYLGIDVHDTPLIPRKMRILPGMVFTVEPGIYIAADRDDVPKEFRGLGVRIEDDVLVTSNNQVEVLTAKCAKEREELVTLFERQASQ